MGGDALGLSYSTKTVGLQNKLLHQSMPANAFPRLAE
jgi:hypothetical protein